MTDAHRSKWRKLVREIKAAFPLPQNVSVLTAPAKRKYFGSCNWNAGKANIYIASHDDYDVRRDALLHEYAHVMSTDSEHGRGWADAYAKLYRWWEFMVQEKLL